MKSIKTKILFYTIIIVILVAAFIGVSSAILTYYSTITILKKSLIETTKVASSRVEAELNEYRKVLKSFTINPTFTNEDSTYEDKINLIEQIKKEFNFTMIDILNEEGISIINQTNMSQSPIFINPKNEKTTYVSDPISYDNYETLSILISTPLIKDGIFKGVMYIGVDAKFMTDIVANIHIGNLGRAAIIDKEGTTIAFFAYDLVLGRYNTAQEAKTDKKLVRLAELESIATKGNSGFGEYFYEKYTRYMSYAPIPNTNNWSIYVTVVKQEFMVPTFISIFSTIALAILSIIISFFAMLKISKSFANPIKQCVERLNLLSKGDLQSNIPVVKTNDEVEILSNSTLTLVNSLKKIINDITYVLNEMANGNMNVSFDTEYVGDFIPLQTSLTKIIKSFNEMLLKIQEISQQISEGSQQISDVANTISQDSNHQSNLIELLSNNINEVVLKVNKNAGNAKEANKISDNALSEVEYENKQIEKMISAMEEINQASNDIRAIIKTIESIASQTNMLALNASIEAARAGESGKSFAVVANSVKELANQSSEAVKNTNTLIENTIESVERGIQIANETAKSIITIVENTKQTNKLVNEISKDSNEQSSSIEEINTKIQDISNILQNTSQIIEESATSSEHFSEQAKVLNELINKFKLHSKLDDVN